MFPERLIEEASLQGNSGGFWFGIRLPWYRALPLSCVDRIEVFAAGQQLAPARISLEMGGDRYGLEELAARHDVWWYVLDSAVVHVAGPPITSGALDLSVTVGLLIPYLPVDGEPLHIVESCTRVLTGQVAA